MADFGACILPTDLSAQIWAYLKLDARVRAQQACRSWNQLMPFQEFRKLEFEIPYKTSSSQQKVLVNQLRRNLIRIGPFLQRLKIRCLQRESWKDIFDILGVYCSVLKELCVEKGSLAVAHLVIVPEWISSLMLEGLEVWPHEAEQLSLALNSLRNLRVFSLKSMFVYKSSTSQSLHLSLNLPKLETLKVFSLNEVFSSFGHRSQVDGIDFPNSPKLSTLWYPHLSGPDLTSVLAMTTLRSLKVVRGSCDNPTLAQVCKNLKNLEFLDLSDNTTLMDFFPIQDLPNLDALIVSGCEFFDFTNCMQLLRHGRISKLDISHTAIFSADEVRSVASFAHLRKLTFGGNPPVSDWAEAGMQASLLSIKDAVHLEFVGVRAHCHPEHLLLFLSYRQGLVGEGMGGFLELCCYCYCRRLSRLAGRNAAANLAWENCNDFWSFGERDECYDVFQYVK